MKRVKLGDVVKITSGGTPKSGVRNYYEDGTISWIRTSDLKVRHIINIQNKITEEGLKNSSAKIFPVNTVLVAMYGATIGACSILKTEAATSQACAAFLPSEEVNEEYLYFYLCSIKQFLTKVSVAGGRQNISGTILKNIEIPLPDLETQRQIAYVLSRAEELISTRQRSFKILDDFLESVFFYFFGDPVNNEKGWQIRPLGDYLRQIDSGWSPVCLDEPKTNDSEWAVLKLGSVTNRYFKPSENKRLPNNMIPRPTIEVQTGDILLSRRNTRELVGACVFVFDTPPRLMMPDTIFRLVTKEELQKQYLWYLLNDVRFRKKVQALASESLGLMSNISKDRLSALLVPVPHFALQTQFAETVNRVYGLKNQQHESLGQLYNLYQSLLKQAFAGELDTSSVLLPEPVQTPLSNTPPSTNSARQVLSFWDVPGTKWQQPPMLSEPHTHQEGFASLTDAVDFVRIEPMPIKFIQPIDVAITPQSTITELTEFLDTSGPVTFEQLYKSFNNTSYSDLKRRIFTELEQGRISLLFDDETNQNVELRLGGRIKLIKTPAK